MKIEYDDQRRIYGVFEEYIIDLHTAFDNQGQAHLKLTEAGVTFPGGFSVSVIAAHQPQIILVQRGESGYPSTLETMRCEACSLIGMAITLEKGALQDALTEAFTAFNQARRAYDETVAHEQREMVRRGRPPLLEGARNAYVGANIPTDLKEWASQQPEGISALIQRLLLAERERQSEVVKTHSKTP